MVFVDQQKDLHWGIPQTDYLVSRNIARREVFPGIKEQVCHDAVAVVGDPEEDELFLRAENKRRADREIDIPWQLVCFGLFQAIHTSRSPVGHGTSGSGT